MPWADGVFSRIWKFVDQFTSGQDITRADLDVALDDLADGLNNYQYEVTDADLAKLADTGFQDQIDEIVTPAKNAAEAAAATANTAASSATSAASSALASIIEFKGQWVNSIAYKKHNVVLDNAILYIAKADMDVGTATSDADYWDIILPRGKGWTGVTLNASGQLVFSSDDGLDFTSDTLTPDLDAAVTAAETAETNAASSASAAATSETNAASSASAAATSASNASTSETNAGNSETAAAASEAKAEKWAEEVEDTEVETGKYSALHHAAKAETAKTAAEAAQTGAETAETNAGNSASSASTSASNASTSAGNASTSETNAAASETKAGEWAEKAEDVEVETGKYSALHHSAKAQAAQTAAETAKTGAETAKTAAETAQSNAETAESNAASSASAASTSASNAATAETGALTALDNFTDIYLGKKASDPTTDNDGDPLADGMLYSNTVLNVMKVYLSGSWRAAYADISDALIKSNNLSDLTDAAAARSNLGLGTAAVAASSSFATAAQGTKADSAVQPVDLATVATSGAYGDLSGLPSLGTAAPLDVPAAGDAAAEEVVKGDDSRLTDARAPTSHSHTLSDITDAGTAAGSDTGDFATAAQGTKADSALQPDAAETLSAAFKATLDDDGTQSTGTYTPSLAAGGQYKKIVNGGAFTLAPPSLSNNQATTLSVFITNNASAGAITTSGFTATSGDSFDTTDGNDFLCTITVYDIGGTEYSFLDVRAMQ